MVGVMKGPHNSLARASIRGRPKPSRLEEARRVIEEYADDLREIIKKLRQRLN